MSNIVFYASLAVILIIPLVFNKDNAESPFELFKMILSGFLILGTMLFYLLNKVKNKAQEFTVSTSFFLIFGLLAVNIFSLFFSINPYLSFWGEIYLPSDSFVSVVFYTIFAFLVLQSVDSDKKITLFTQALTLVFTLQVIYGFIQLFGLDPLVWSRAEVFGIFGNTIAYSNIIGCLMPVACYLFFTTNSQILKIALCFVLFGGNYIILETGSRAPVLTNLCTQALIIFYFVWNRKQFKTSARALLLIGLVLASNLLFFKIKKDAQLVKKTSTALLSKGWETRKILITSGIEAWKENPVIGNGPQTFSVAQRKHQPQDMNKYEYWKHPWTKAHNHLIQTLSDLGLMGLLISLSMYFYLLFNAVRIFFKTSADQSSALAVTFFFSYQFLYISNLTNFNFIYAQILFFAFPVLFDISRKKTVKIQFEPKKYLRVLVGATAILSTFYLLFKTYIYWQSDVEYQKSRYYREFKPDYLKSVEHVQRAIALNEQEPIFHCHLATLYAEMLTKNKESLSAHNRDSVLNEIDKSVTDCLNTAKNRDHLFFVAGLLYGNLYINDIIFNPEKALKNLQQAEQMAPTNPHPPSRMARLYLKNGQDDLFLKSLSRTLELKQDFIPAYYDLFEYYYLKKDFESVTKIRNRLNTVNFYNYEFLNSLVSLSDLAVKYDDDLTKNAALEVYNKFSYLYEQKN